MEEKLMDEHEKLMQANPVNEHDFLEVVRKGLSLKKIEPIWSLSSSVRKIKLDAFSSIVIMKSSNNLAKFVV